MGRPRQVSELDAVGRESERVRVAEAEFRAKSIAQAKRIAGAPKTAPQAPAKTGRWPQCEYFHCNNRCEIEGPQGETPDAARGRIEKGAPANGFFLGRNRHDVLSLYCSGICHQRDTTPNVMVAPIVKPAGPHRFPPPKFAPVPGGVLQCNQVTCYAVLHTKTTALAATMTWVESEHGIFCGQDCAKQAAVDVKLGPGTKSSIAAKASISAKPPSPSAQPRERA